MKQYLLSIYHPDGEPPPPEVLEPIMRNVAALASEMKAAGAHVWSGGLYPSSAATVVRPQESEFLITDGPFVEGKEHVGGISVIRARDLDEALGWGRKLARAIGVPIEVRPFREEQH